VHVSVIGNPDGSVVVALRGNLDLGNATVLDTTIAQILERPVPCIVVDLAGVDHCDSTGLSSLIVAHKRAEAAGGWLRLAAPSTWLRGLLGTVDLGIAFTIYPAVADALAG
jgi:anti-sigma B factor antagonist